MQSQAHQQKILKILKGLPPDKLDAVMAFAEHMKTKGETAQKTKKKTGPSKIPTFRLGQIEKNAFDRSGLYGEHLDRKFD